MLVCCPKCKSQYNIDDSLISELEKKARCYKCETIFSLRLRKRKTTEERVGTHAGGSESWEKEPEDHSDSSLVPADILEQPPRNTPFIDQLNQIEIPENLKSQNDVSAGSLEAEQIEDFFSDIEDLPTHPDKVHPEPSQENQTLPPTPSNEQSPESLTGEMEELLGELSDFPKVIKSGIILEKDVDQAISSETEESGPEDELDQLLNESEISSAEQSQPGDNLSEPPAQEEDKDTDASKTEEPETATAPQNESMTDMGSQNNIDQILQDAKNTGLKEAEKSNAEKDVNNNSPETVSNDDIDAILQQAKSEDGNQTDEQDSIDQILQDAKNTATDEGGLKSDSPDDLNNNSPETVSNDDIDAILQQAKSEDGNQTDEQDSIDQILQDAKNTATDEGGLKSDSPDDVNDNSPETVSNDDIDAILQQAKSEAGNQTGEQDNIDQILQDAKNTATDEGGLKSDSPDDVNDNSPETVSNDDIDAILQQAKSEDGNQTDEQDSIDQILQDAKDTTTDMGGQKSDSPDDVNDNSPETVSNDDIDAILQQAKSEAGNQTGEQDSIDQILQDAKDTATDEGGLKSDSPDDVNDNSPETVSNDDIDAILQQAKSEAGNQTDEQDSIDQILQDAKGDSAEPQQEVSVGAASDNGILTEDMLAELLSGEGEQDPGGILQEAGEDEQETHEETDEDAESIGDGDDSADSADNTPGEEEGDSSGDILTESDLESLLSGDGGEDPGFMSEEAPEATDDTGATEQAGDGIPEGADSLDDLDQTVVADSSGLEEEIPDIPDRDEEDDFHEESDEDIEDEGEGKKKKISLKLLFFPFIKIWLLFSSLAGKLFKKKKKKKKKSDEDEDEEEEDEDEIANVEDEDEEEDEENGDSKKSNKKKRFLKAKYLVLFFAVCAILAGAAFYFLKNQPETPDSEDAEKTVDVSTEKELLPEPPLLEPTRPAETENKEVSISEKKPKLEEMARDSDTVNMGLVLPIYRDPGKFKVLDMIIKIIFDSSKTASRVRDNLPYYEMKIEESIDLFFSDKFYNDIPFVKNRLRKTLKTDISKMVKFGKVKKVRIKFIKIQKMEPDIEESKEGA